MHIKILGTGCPKCERLEKVARQVTSELGIEADFTKVKEIDKIMSYDIMNTPALVIDEEVMSSGRIPSKVEIADLIQVK